MLEQAILSYFLHHAHVYKKEDNWKERAAIYADAIDHGTHPRRVLRWGQANRLKLVALVITVGEIESHWAQYIHENRCLEGPWKCDVDPKTGQPRARSNWQLWPVACGQWSQIEGADIRSTRVAATCAAKRLSGAMSYCKTLKGAFNYYAGKPCNDNWKGSNKRVAKFNKVYAILSR